MLPPIGVMFFLLVGFFSNGSCTIMTVSGCVIGYSASKTELLFMQHMCEKSSMQQGELPIARSMPLCKLSPYANAFCWDTLAYQKGSLFLEGKFQTTILRVVNLTLLRDHVYYHVYSEINLVAYSRFASSSDMHCRTDSVQFQSSSNDSNVSPAKPQAFCWAFLQDSTICWENQYMCTAKVVTVRFCSNSFTCKR